MPINPEVLPEIGSALKPEVAAEAGAEMGPDVASKINPETELKPENERGLDLKKIQEEIKEKESKKRKCPNCGENIPQLDDFCPYCAEARQLEVARKEADAAFGEGEKE